MLALALQHFKPNQLGAAISQPQAQPVPMETVADAVDKPQWTGSRDRPEFIENSGIAGVAAMVGEALVDKKAAEIAKRGPQTAREERLLKFKGYDNGKQEESGRSIFARLFDKEDGK